MRDRASVATVVRVALIASICMVVGCHTRDADESSVRVTRAQVIGVYETKFDNGSERLELKDDGTYFQDFTSSFQSFHHTGEWHINNLFLDGSVIVLFNAGLSQKAGTHALSYGDLHLYTHDRSGKIVLARNEVAEWYYERISK